MTTTTGAGAAKRRRGYAGQVDALLDAAAAASADVPDVGTAHAAPANPADSSSPASASVPSGDVGPRLRHAGKAATLTNGDVRRTVYVGADDWRAVLRLAYVQGVTASDVVRSALRSYLLQHGGDSGPTS